MIETQQTSDVLARAFGGDRPSKVVKLPNGRAVFYDLPIKRRGHHTSWQARAWRRFIGGNLANPQMGGVGDSGVPTRTQIVVFQILLTPASVNTIVAVEQAFTITGILATDILAYMANSVDAATATGATTGHVTAANTVKLGYVNPTAGALTPTAGTYNVVVLRG